MKQNNDQQQVSELMKPRYKVIADYPHSRFDMGDILVETRIELSKSIAPDHQISFARIISTNSIQPDIRTPDKYPAIFKPLQWWEEREANEMPEYVKDAESGKYIFKVLQYWGKDNEYFRQHPDYGYEQLCTEHFTPATEAQYLSKINSKD